MTTDQMADQLGSRQAGAQRTRQRILAAADATLVDAEMISLNAVAKRAGVGVGTVYRHFPTPEALVLAVYEFEVQQLVETVPTLLRAHPPAEAFRRWAIDHLGHYVTTKRGLADALRAAATGRDAHNRAFENMTAAVAALIQANLEAGTVRPDLNPRTVLLALSGSLLLDPKGDRQTQITSLVDLLWHGMRTDHLAGRHPADPGPIRPVRGP